MFYSYVIKIYFEIMQTQIVIKSIKREFTWQRAMATTE